MSAPLQSSLTNRSAIRVIKQRVIGAHKHPSEDDYLAIEDPLEINIIDHDGGSERLVTMRTPGADEDLIHGYLFGEGVIESAADIVDISFSERGPAAPTQAFVQLRPGVTANLPERSGAVQSSCGVCGTDSLQGLAIGSDLTIRDESRRQASWIHTLPERMRLEQTTFEQTGGLHATALFDEESELFAAREDIGRHNALDKAIGAVLRFGRIGHAGMTLCVSGRMSYEILQKGLRARIPIIAGVGAPSSLAVAIANDFNVTLIGFVRNGAYNIYSCPERLV